MERIKTIEQVRNQTIPIAFPEPYAQILHSLIQLQPAARPTTTQLRECLRLVNQSESAAIVELQDQMESLNAELVKLQSATSADSPQLRDQLEAKKEEIISKNAEILRLQRVVVRNANEMRSKDAEIRRLKAKLRQRISSVGEGDA